MRHLKYYLFLIITLLMIQACGGGKISSVSLQKSINITTLGTNKIWQKDPVLKNWSNAKQYCSDLDIDDLNWRLPTSSEFIELLDNNRSIDENFPEESQIKEFWTETQTSLDDTKAWKVSTWSNSEIYTDKNKILGVRCISGSKPIKHTFHTENNTTIEITPNSGKKLLWQDINNSKLFTFEEALEYCKKQNLRLPSIYELQNTVDKESLETKKFNFIYENFIPYWSNTQLPTNQNSLLTLNYTTGGISSNNKNTKNYVRCMKVLDFNPPIINLSGEDTIIIKKGDTYIDSGATAYDNIEGNKTISITGEVDTTKVGSYTITYSSTDDNGNTATETRTIYVEDTIFTPHEVTKNAINSEWIEMGDLDNDGDLDIISGSREGVQDAWFENLGNNNNFTQHIINTDSSGEVTSIHVADISNNGYLDIVYIKPEEDKSIVYCINNKNKTFDCTSSEVPNQFKSNDIVLIDINNNGEGTPDIVSISKEHNSVDYYWKKSEGFQNPRPIGNNISNLTSLDYAKLNNDNYFDIVVGAGDNLLWLSKNGNGADSNFTKENTIATVPDISSVFVADIDGDGYSDIISTSKSNHEIYWHKHEGSETPTFSNKYTITSNLKNLYYASGIDLDNDGDIDILSNSSETNGKIVWYENIGENSNFIEHIISIKQNNVIRVFAADIDNDGNRDIIAGKADGTIIFYENTNIENEKLLLKTGQVTSHYYLDDGDYKKGQEHSYSRDNTLKIVTDNTTGLIWQDNTDTTTLFKNWEESNNYCRNLIIGDYIDWRLPDIKSLYFLMKKDSLDSMDNIFEFNTNRAYWSNHKFTVDDETKASYVNFENYDEHYSETDELKNIRCVRGKQQTFNFIRNDINNIVVDNIHKLIWDDTTDANTTNLTWEEAIDYCRDLDITGSNDWRLPNIHELYSIIDTNKRDFTFHNTFKYITSKEYWSSTTNYFNNKKYTVDFNTGHDEWEEKESILSVRCVRDLQ